MLNKKIFASMVAVSLLAGTGTGVYAYNQKIEAGKLEQLRIENLENAKSAVDSLYNSSKTRLSEDVLEKLKEAEKEVRKLDDSKQKSSLLSEIKDVKEVSEVQEEVYSTLNNNVLVEDVTEEQLEDILANLVVIKEINDPIYKHLSEYLSEAEKQLADINTAIIHISKAEEKLSRESYEDAQKSVEKVKNKVKKKDLQHKLAAVNEKLVAKEDEVKRKQEEQAKLAAEKAASENTSINQSVGNQQSAISNNNTNKSTTSNAPGSSNSTNNTTKSNTGSKSSGSNNSNPSNNNSNPSNNNSKPATSSGSSSSSSGSSSNETNWDQIGENLENHDWSNTGSGEIDEGGNTWESWE
ncbi:hypothetical protein [Cytobacillus kochii]|uniref:hypothetical protein n=1 Tax=Cytobacillus kochii TaxID=859143 RepID=UPI0024802408|nr:hypothetical protein [Cytobacillus kochii]